MNTKSPATTTDDALFEFEKMARRSHRGGMLALQERDKMIERLGLQGQISGPFGELVPLIREFVVQCHLNIVWYQNALKNEKMMRGFFFFLSLLLLLLVPLFVLYIPTFISTGASDDQSATRAAQDVTAQVTAILTGLLGFQRSISAWLDKRKVAVSYAQTSAKLKQIVWTLLDKWNDREILPAVKSELAEDLRDGISNARMIASEEQLFYFQNMSYPAIDVGAALKSAGSDAYPGLFIVTR